ncbi:MAG: OmpA family protein [bacterium]
MIENFDDYRIQPNQDTIVIRNNVGKWWFGPLVGLNADIYFNSLTTLKFPGIPENPFNTRLNFTAGQDLGWFTGGFIEYMPPGKILAYGARVYVPDYRYSSSEMVQQMDLSEYKYQYSGVYKYASFAPYAKYNFPIEGLYATLGLNLDFPYSNEASLIHIRLDDAKITHDLKMTHEQMKIRYGVEIGAGWEFTVNDINDKVRVRFNPYLTASAGTKILADLNSNWNNVIIKLGFAIKFSLNEITIDTLKYNIESISRPEIYALVSTPEQVFFEAAGLSESLPAYELDASKREEPFIQVALEGSMGRINSGTAINPVSELPGTAPAGFGEANNPLENINIKQEEVLKLDFGEKNIKKLVYSRARDIKLTDEMKNYLDVIIAYTKTKAIREIYIFGYTEELGSRQKNLDVSKQRAEVAYKYLINAGVGKKVQIFRDGKGALVPVIEAGKRADVKLNNRIEILIK